MDAVDLNARWTAAWGNCRPVSYELRSCLHDRWVRFHSLPNSQRYASNDDEYAELLRRHKTVIAELMQDQPGDGEQELLIFTASWSADSEPKERDAELLTVIPAATYWTSVLTDDSERAEPTWTHLWVSTTHRDGEDLAQLLCLVADYATGGVIITTAEMGWLYAPYDGGADVIAASGEHRDQLGQRHQNWLSAHPKGL
jgi:hypothetical protein